VVFWRDHADELEEDDAEESAHRERRGQQLHGGGIRCSGSEWQRENERAGSEAEHETLSDNEREEAYDDDACTPGHTGCSVTVPDADMRRNGATELALDLPGCGEPERAAGAVQTWTVPAAPMR
jgi:hypothetical protein